MDGFEIFNNPQIKDLVSDLRNKITYVFNAASLASGSSEITTDDDICELYIKNKSAWIAAYDSIRLLPQLCNLAGSSVIIDYLRECGVLQPALSSPNIAVRVDMPAGEGSMPFPSHQDYPYNRGSNNGIVVWIPLQDTDEQLGCLQYSPNTHKDGFIKGNTPKTDRLSGVILTDDYVLKSIPMLAGDALLFSMFLVHKSGVNSTRGSIRFSVQIRYNDLSDVNFAERGFNPHPKEDYL